MRLGGSPAGGSFGGLGTEGVAAQGLLEAHGYAEGQEPLRASLGIRSSAVAGVVIEED